VGNPGEKRSRSSEPEGSGTPERGRSGWRKLLPDNPWAIIGPIIAALTVAGVTAAVTGLFSSEPAGELQGFDPVVANPAVNYEGVPDPSNPALTASRQTDDSKPRIEIRLQNIGNRRSVLTSAILTVRREVVVAPCGLGAGLLVSATYDVLLPNRAAEGHTVEVPIDQQLGPDEADRFAFNLGLEDPAKDFGLILVYQLDVAARHDNSDTPVDLGRVVVALPGTLPPDTLDYMRQQLSTNPEEPCAQDYLNQVGQVSQLDGVRSPELESLLATARA
jgi:hypothetical protein